MEGDRRFMMEYDGAEGQYFLQQLMMAGAGDHDPAGGVGAGSGGGGERKRRFTEDQVRSLETTFHARRAKLEPREKAELARELGLKPRQVAIWFQNKRARWRSKQLEQDYAALRAQCDALHAGVEELKQEKLALAAQVDDLRGRLKEQQDQMSGTCDDAAASAEEGDGKRSDSASCCLAGDDGTVAAAPPVLAASEGSVAAAVSYSYDVDDHPATFVGDLPDPFCAAATPELWDTWPLVEWNAVA